MSKRLIFDADISEVLSKQLVLVETAGTLIMYAIRRFEHHEWSMKLNSFTLLTPDNLLMHRYVPLTRTVCTLHQNFGFTRIQLILR